ncbi:MAG: hypothetical protein KC766_18705 [Myxococcales bacterium]|nr:hypothetical protein [Myxococcales bacterium]
MDYRLVQAQPGRVVMQRTRTLQFVLGGVLLLLGLPALALGAFLALADPLLGAKSAGFGLTFTGAGLLVLTRRNGPGAFVFDDAEAALLVFASTTATGQPEGRLPYSEIEGFRVRRQVSRSSEGRSVHHALEVAKRDGVAWTLYTSQSERKTRKLLERLQANCNPARSTGSSPAPAESGTFQITREPGRTLIEFRKPYRLVTQITAMMTVGGISLAVLGFQDQMPSALFYGVLAFTVLVLAGVLIGLVNGLNKRGLITLTPERFRSDERGGIIKSWFEEPLENLHAVCFTYHPSQGQQSVMLLNRQQHDTLTREVPDDPMSALSVAMGMIGVRRIEVGELGLAQKLELEQLIQSEVERVSGKRLL